jgi:hypothetical protein
MIRKYLMRLHAAAALLALALTIPQATFADNQQVDRDLLSAGNQNVVSLNVAPGSLVTTSAQIVIDYSGQNHLPAGPVAFAVNPAQTTLPTGYTVASTTATIPPGWGTAVTSVPTSPAAVTFTAPTAAGSYSYAVKWDPTSNYGNKLTGSSAFVINLTVAAMSAPVVTPIVTGTQGSDGWYTGDVTVTWSVSDPASVTSMTGCGVTTLDADTGGTTLTCSATSSGGTTTRSITVQRDATIPTLDSSRTPANASGWNSADVTVSFSCSDVTSGIRSCSDSTTLSAEGENQAVSGSAEDHAGNTATTTVSGINIDKTPPTISGAPTASPNASGWYNAPVTVHFQCDDPLSGVASCSNDVLLDTDGTNQSTSGAATDKAGNNADAVVEGINIDTTAPEVTISDVAQDGTYALGAVPTLSCSATDHGAGLVGPCTGTYSSLPTTATGVGTYTFSATAADKAGNTTTKSVTYRVVYPTGQVLQPILAPVQTFRAGSTIPVKFRLADASGQPIRTAVATLAANGSAATSQGGANVGNQFRYDATDQLYIFNLSTRGMAAGPLKLVVGLDDGTTREVTVALK